MPMEEQHKHLYESVADRITQLIAQGTFRAGERIPSVRQLSRQFQVSITTVLEAYRLLENRGTIEARPQSGYYVRASFPLALEEPQISRPPIEPTPVSLGELAVQILRDMGDPSRLQLGAALPHPDVLQLEKLNRALARVARRGDRMGSVYEMPPGYEALRLQIARRLTLAGCALAPSQIVITSGCQEAIYLCLRAVCEPGDTVAIESPIFYGVLQAIESLGLKALEIPTHPRDGISLEALTNAVETVSVKACVVVSNYNNPLGSRIPDENKRKLVELLAARDIPLIEDDNYGELSFDTARPMVAKAFDTNGLVLLCASFSKTLAPGYRIGWVAPGRYQAKVERLKVACNLATSMPPQLALAEYLEGGGYDHHLRRVRRIYAQHTARMAQAIGEYFPPGTRVTRPGGGFVLWVELRPHIDSVALYEQALRAGITLAPGPLFSATQKYRNFLRLNASYWSPETERGLETLGKLAAGFPQ
ncbi:MAG: PLP-dependent aminotransferase family protein [Armatimonas sp.]